MLKIVCCGMQAKKMVELAKQVGGDAIQVSELSDMKGAQGVKNGTYDYYIGTCQTGGGGSLGMAVAVLGVNKTKILGTPGRVPSPTDIEKAVQQDFKAFGLPYDQIQKVVPHLVRALLKKYDAETEG